jgi:CRISPR-associated protein Csy1
MQHPLSEKIQDYIQQRANARIEKLDKELKKKREQGLGEDECAELRNKELERFIPHVWLSDAAKRASQIKLVTHALKFTHTEAKGSSVYLKSLPSESNNYLHSATLLTSQVDVVGNAAALDVAGLLKLTDNNQAVYQLLANHDLVAFQPFAQDDNQLEQWGSGFSEVFSLFSPSSHKYAKQAYFPVVESYHLLAPLFSSSLMQALHERIMENRFSEHNKHIRSQKRNGLYCAFPSVDYPDLALQSFGGTKPQNVSQLNSARAGRAQLLPSSPPKWQRQFNLPKSSFSFWLAYSRRASKVLREMVKFLKRVDDCNNITIREQRKDFTEQAIDIFLLQSTQIREAKDKAGWSEQTDMAKFEQCWLDPYRQDEDFQQEKQSGDWVTGLADRYARRLNEQLRYYGLNVAAAEHQTWLKQVKQSMVDDIRIFNL